MQSRSACAECLLCSVLCLALSCASPKPGPALGRGPAVTLEGEITLSGPSAIEKRLVLADAGGGFCELRSAVFEDEFRSLAGHRVRVTGRLAGKTAEGAEFLVESYELAPVNGFRPVIGIVQTREGALVLREMLSGREYRLEGRLAQALRPYIDYKVWVSGPGAVDEGGGGRAAADAGDLGRAATLTVESYGVLVPSAGAVNREP